VCVCVYREIDRTVTALGVEGSHYVFQGLVPHWCFSRELVCFEGLMR
jgi:hypothetical protein